MPTLAELIHNLNALDDEATIYTAEGPDAKPSSQAVVVSESTNGDLPPEAGGMEYFLEVTIAKEVINVWREWRKGKIPTNLEKCEAIIYYAKNDSYLPIT